MQTTMHADYVEAKRFIEFLEDRIKFFESVLQKEREEILPKLEEYYKKFFRFFIEKPELSEGYRLCKYRLGEYNEQLRRIKYQSRNTSMVIPSDEGMLKLFYKYVEDESAAKTLWN